MVTIKGTEGRYRIGPIEKSSPGNGYQSGEKKDTQQRTNEFNLAEIRMARARQEEATDELQEAIRQHTQIQEKLSNLATPEKDKIPLKLERDRLNDKIKNLRNR
jgi:hypothetical protein